MSTGLLLLRSPLVYCRLMAVFMHCCQSPPCSFQFAPPDNLAFGSESTIVLRVIFVVVWPPSLCCCISVGLLLNLAATVTPEIRTHIPTSPVIGGAKLYTPKARISTAATNQMWASASVGLELSQCECELRSACRKKFRSPTMFWRHLQQVSYSRRKCEVMCGVGARPASIQCEVECGVGARPAVFSVRSSVSLCGGFWREEEVRWRFKGNISLKSFWWNSFLSYR